MSMRHLRVGGWTIVPFVLALAVGACEEMGLEFQPISAVLVGSVSTEAGQPLGGVEIEASIVLEDFPGQGCVDPPAQVLRLSTAADGTFEAVLQGQAGLGDQNGCVDLVATPPDGSGLKADTLLKIPVVFRRDPPIDTVTVNFVLRDP